jgi:hypothetical protein
MRPRSGRAGEVAARSIDRIAAGASNNALDIRRDVSLRSGGAYVRASSSRWRPRSREMRTDVRPWPEVDEGEGNTSVPQPPIRGPTEVAL